MWQFVQDIPPGARLGASAGVFVNSRKPRLISSDSGDVSSEASSGFFGIAHAATIVALEAISGPAIFGPVEAAGAGA